MGPLAAAARAVPEYDSVLRQAGAEPLGRAQHQQTPSHLERHERHSGTLRLRVGEMPALSASAVAEADRLALAYGAGHRHSLGELYRVLAPLIVVALRRAAVRGLPSVLEAGDLAQQSWVILAELAQRWRPELGTFAAYIVTSLPWALQRYLRRHSPTRRAARVQVLSVGEEELQCLLDEQVGDDGQSWADRLACQELLAPLPVLERSVLTLRAIERRSFSSVATALGISPGAARCLFAQARATLRADEPEPELVRLVYALHQGATAGGLLPGRAWVRARTGLSQPRYTQLMQRLVSAGCIQGRSARRGGTLVERNASATLRRVVILRQAQDER